MRQFLEKYRHSPILFFALGVLITAIVAFLVLHATQGDSRKSINSVEKYVYHKLTMVEEPLRNYLQTGEEADLQSAKETLCKLAAVCNSQGDNGYPYLATDDHMTDINAAWCIRFFARCYAYLDAIEGPLSPEDEVTIGLIADAFSPDEAGRVTFSSVFHIATFSDLLYNNDLSLNIEYNAAQQLVLPEF